MSIAKIKQHDNSTINDSEAAMAYLSSEALEELKFKYLGRNVKISEKAAIYNPGKISLGNNVRVDDFCILSAGVKGIDIGKYVHIACYVSLIGREKITIEDFAGISARVSVYSSSDDYSGYFMTNPTIPAEFTNVTHAPVVIKKHVIIGAGTVILPGVTIGTGAAIGALCLITNDIEEFTVNTGSLRPRQIQRREKKFLSLEKKFLSKNSSEKV